MSRRTQCSSACAISCSIRFLTTLLPGMSPSETDCHRYGAPAVAATIAVLDRANPGAPRKWDGPDWGASTRPLRSCGHGRATSPQPDAYQRERNLADITRDVDGLDTP